MQILHYTIKYNSSGDQIWSNTFNTNGADRAFGVAVDSSENVYVVGYSDFGGDQDYLLIKLNSTGDYEWNRTYDTGGNDYGWGTAVDSSGNVYATGSNSLGNIFTIKKS